MHENLSKNFNNLTFKIWCESKLCHIFSQKQSFKRDLIWLEFNPMTVENLLLPLDFLKCLFLHGVTSYWEAEYLSTSETHRCFFFPWPAGWLRRQRSNRERQKRGQREKTGSLKRQRGRHSAGRGMSYLGAEGGGKRGRHDVREKQMPGDKKARVRDRWREQEHNIRIRWRPEVIFARFHGCTGLRSM